MQRAAETELLTRFPFRGTYSVSYIASKEVWIKSRLVLEVGKFYLLACNVFAILVAILVMCLLS